MNRQEYNQSRYTHQKGVNERLRQFAEANPERFAELQKQARDELEHEKEHPPVRHVTRYALPGTRALTTEDLDQIAYNPKERHYLIKADCAFDDSHVFFESVEAEQANPSFILQHVQQRHPRYQPVKVTSIEPCRCPACIRRHGAS